MRQSPQGITAVISMDSTFFGPAGHYFDVVLSTWVSQIQPNLTHRSHLCLTPTQHLPTWAKHSQGQHSTLNLPSRDCSAGKDPFGKEKDRKELVGRSHLLLAGWSDFIHSPSTMDTSSIAMSPSIPGPRIPSKMSWEKEHQRVVN